MTARCAVITGGAGGIGAATAERLAAKGFAVLVVDRDLAAAEAVAQRLGQPSSACAADVSNEDDVKGYVAAAIERVAVASGAFEKEIPSSSSSSSPSSPPPLLPDPGWRMPSSDLPWVARHCLDAGALLLAVVVGVPSLLLWALWLAVSRLLFSVSRRTKPLASSSFSSSRPRRSSSMGAASGDAAAAEHAKLS